jgi:hypothetical protein
MLVTTGAVVQCSFGLSPTEFVASGEVVSATTPVGVVTDVTPVNIETFGMCISPANPAVIAATTAALGVPTPAPCVPVLTPWEPGALRVVVNGVPALNQWSACECAWAGVVSVSDPGQLRSQAM